VSNVSIFGSGPPLVLIPGVNGRWEWVRPTVDALARDFRVATFSLCGEPGMPPMPGAFDEHLRQVDAAIDALGVERAVILGISFGGWVAVRYASLRPGRVAGLVLASAPGPGYSLPPRHARWIAAPRRSMPIFVATAPRRTGPEIRAAIPAWRERLAFSIQQGWRTLRAPMSGVRAAARIRLALSHDFGADAARLACPLLCVTGEDGLDNVVPAASTREYLTLVAGARYERLDRTGHMGVVTRAGTFAALVRDFVRPLDASVARSVPRAETLPRRGPAAARPVEDL
jgi:pimeloyl-ACP methyl ester carboxylesterase